MVAGGGMRKKGRQKKKASAWSHLKERWSLILASLRWIKLDAIRSLHGKCCKNVMCSSSLWNSNILEPFYSALFIFIFSALPSTGTTFVLINCRDPEMYWWEGDSSKCRKLWLCISLHLACSFASWMLSIWALLLFRLINDSNCS